MILQAEVPGGAGEQSIAADPRRIVLTESCCQGCGVHVVLVHHESFPEMRIEALSAGRAAEHLANRLEAILDSATEPSSRETVLGALADARSFLGGIAHVGQNVGEPTTQPKENSNGDSSRVPRHAR